MSKNPKNQWNLMKIANTNREILQNFWTTWVISMKFSGMMWLMIISKVTKKQSFTLSLEDTFFDKPQGGGSNWPPSHFKVKEVHQSYIFSKMLPYQTTELFKYWCPIEFVYAYQVNTSSTRAGISFHILNFW